VAIRYSFNARTNASYFFHYHLKHGNSSFPCWSRPLRCHAPSLPNNNRSIRTACMVGGKEEPSLLSHTQAERGPSLRAAEWLFKFAGLAGRVYFQTFHTTMHQSC
jgi:hypothetical protein